ncbi:MAG: hypothetical protein ABUT20_08545, partial [Bacteroidota bacterium]
SGTCNIPGRSKPSSSRINASSGGRQSSPKEDAHHPAEVNRFLPEVEQLHGGNSNLPWCNDPLLRGDAQLPRSSSPYVPGSIQLLICNAGFPAGNDSHLSEDN